MVRIGEDVLAVTPAGESSGLVAISVRTPTVGSKVLVVETDAGPVAVKPFNAYVGDEGISMPLPCGTSVFLPSEPPNYLPPSWESGFGMSCRQGIPQTQGWTCSGSCPINPSTHPTPGERCQLAYGGVNRAHAYMSLPLKERERIANLCTHATEGARWRANAFYHHDANINYYKCTKKCYEEFEQWNPNTKKIEKYKRYCKLYNTETAVAYYRPNWGSPVGTKWPDGCFNTFARGWDRLWKVAILSDGSMVDAYYSYGCFKEKPSDICPLFRNGLGTPFITCGIKGAGDKGPGFTPGQKPAGCKHQGHLNFDGWDVPGGEQNESTSCTFSKATEGARSRSDGEIRCKFMSPSGVLGEVSGAGDVVNPISPSNTNAFGKAGSQLSVNANISISGRVDMDYTRVPTRQSKSGTACAFTIGRY